MTDYTDEAKAFCRLLELVERLRRECPWDREQTMDSLRTLTIEEVYELCDAILKHSETDIRKELGDVLLHVVFYALIAKEQNMFGITDVIESLCSKLIYRHPHVFGEAAAADANEVVQRWESIKLTERGSKGATLEGVPKSLPALVKAHRIQDKARAAGFDWEIKEQIWEKAKEEIAELEAELKQDCGDNKDAVEAEFGDVLFVIVNAMRLYGIDPETALERTNVKFISRFNYMESHCGERRFASLSFDEKDALWRQAKEEERLAQKDAK